MKKQDIIILVVLGLLFVAWPYIDRQFVSRIFPPEPAPAQEGPAEVPVSPQADEGTPEASAAPGMDEPIEEDAPAVAGAEAEAAPEETARAPLPPARMAVLENDDLRLELSSHGAAVVNAVLKRYPLSGAEDSPPVEFSFTNAPTLSYQDLPGFGPDSNFELLASDFGSAVFERKSDNGLVLERRYGLDEGYLLQVTDTWRVSGDEAIDLDSARVQLGWMESLPGISSIRGMMFLGVDSLSSGGKVRYWGKKMKGFFEEQAGTKSSRRLPRRIALDPWGGQRNMDWIAVKNKYFAQILTPSALVAHGEVRAERKATISESPGSDLKDSEFELARVGAALELEGQSVTPGQPLVWNYSCYIGPKKLSALKELADHKADIMQLGIMGGIGRILLKMLNTIHALIPNYGLAIIILTFIIKLIFWPITHKGMQGMRRMQELQPEMNAIKEKHKDDKQKQQQAMAELWKKHKINPLGGCLPLLVQIPVFIALFTVLRSAIELRFSEFLWIKDLSEPEHLFSLGFSIPFLGEYFNLLPILMAVTMWLQQRMTPSTGDAQQQRMMAVFMPIMIFVMLYNFPSGLILYWTTNQVATIVGQAVSRRRHAGDKKPA